MNYSKTVALLLCFSTVALASDENNSSQTSAIAQQNQRMETIPQENKRNADSLDGYSYLRVAVQNMKYKEHYVYKNDNGAIKKGDVQENDFSGTNIVYMGGGLSRINDQYDFSLDSISTLIPSEIDEKWTLNQATINQKNRATIDFTQVNLLLHQKYGKHHRAVGGIEFKKLAFERYDYDTIQDIPDDKLPLVNIRERLSSLSLDAGYWYESKSVGIGGIRYMTKALVKIPFWQKAENTAHPDITFSDVSGYDVELDGELAYTIYPNIELGLLGSYGYIYRTGQDKGTIHWPENTYTSYTTGLSVNWKL